MGLFRKMKYRADSRQSSRAAEWIASSILKMQQRWSVWMGQQFDPLSYRRKLVYYYAFLAMGLGLSASGVLNTFWPAHHVARPIGRIRAPATVASQANRKATDSASKACNSAGKPFLTDTIHHQQNKDSNELNQ